MTENVSIYTLEMVAAICGDPTLTAIFRGCHTDADLTKQWETYRSTVEKLTQNWCERAGITSGVAHTATAATASGTATRSKDAILQDFIDSVRVVASSITIAELSAWLEDTDSGNDRIKEIKREFKEKYATNPEAALVYLKQKQVDVLMAGNWV